MDDKYKFQKLTPINDIDLSVYQEALDFVFENDDLNFLARTAPERAAF